MGRSVHADQPHQTTPRSRAALFTHRVPDKCDRVRERLTGLPLDAACAVLTGTSCPVAACVNCSEQADVLGRGPHAVAATGLPAVAYPNRGGTWDAAAKRCAYGDPVDLALVDAWVDAGARFVGGCCCGNGTAEIAALARHLSRR